MSDVKEMDIYPDEMGRFVAEPGDLLVCEGGESGRAAIWNGSSAIGIQNALHRIRPKVGISSRYLLYYFEWQVKSRMIDHLLSGVTITHFTQEKLRKMLVQYPPLEEQKRIVEVLDVHLSKLDKAIADLDHADSQTLVFRRSILNSLVNHKVSESEPGVERLSVHWQNWEFKALGAVANIQKGATITAKAARPGSIPVIAGGQKPAYYHDIPNRQAKTITVSASGAYAGFVAFHKEPIWASDCVTLEPNDKEQMLAEYLYYFMLSKQTEIFSLQRGSGMPHVYAKDIATLEIPVPPLAEQGRIVETLDDYLSALETSRILIAGQKDSLQALRRSLLNKAFTGQLGTN
jgi:restriction endonuclease S subunit